MAHRPAPRPDNPSALSEPAVFAWLASPVTSFSDSDDRTARPGIDPVIDPPDRTEQQRQQTDDDPDPVRPTARAAGQFLALDQGDENAHERGEAQRQWRGTG